MFVQHQRIKAHALRFEIFRNVAVIQPRAVCRIEVFVRQTEEAAIRINGLFRDSGILLLYKISNLHGDLPDSSLNAART